MCDMDRFLKKSWIFLLLAVVGMIMYWPAISAPWYFDDFTLLDRFERGSLQSYLYNIFSPRSLAYISFYLNFDLFGVDVAAFRVVNISIHILNAWLVYLILLKIIPGRTGVALALSLLFLVHPVQTQPVIYIVQRMTLLSAFFALLSFYVFMFFCEAVKEGKKVSSLYLLGVLIVGILSMFSKENTAILPFVMVAYLFLYYPEIAKAKKQIPMVLSIFIMVLPIVFVHFNMAGSTSAHLATEVPVFSDWGESVYQLNPSRDWLNLKYFLTQFKVFWLYVGLLLLPAGQSLLYDYPLVNELDVITVFAVVGVLLSIAFLFLFRRNRLVLFSGIWIVSFLAIESSVFPLDAVFEHRLYLPFVGFSLLAFAALDVLLPSRYLKVATLAILLVASIGCFQRAGVWATPLSFWQASFTTIPESPRVRYLLARELLHEKRYSDIVQLLEKTVEKNPDDFVFAQDILAEAYFELGRYDLAFSRLEKLKKKFPAESKLYYFQGRLAGNHGDYSQAVYFYEKSLLVQERDVRTLYQLARLYEASGEFILAAEYYTRVMFDELFRVDGYYPVDELRLLAKQNYERLRHRLDAIIVIQKQQVARENIQQRADLAELYHRIGYYSEAVLLYRAIESDFGENWQINANIASIFKRQKFFVAAADEYERGLTLEPCSGRLLDSLASVYKRQGHIKRAEDLLVKSVKCDSRYFYSYFNLASLYFHSGRFAESRPLFEYVYLNFPEKRAIAKSYLDRLSYLNSN